MCCFRRFDVFFSFLFLRCHFAEHTRWFAPFPFSCVLRVPGPAYVRGTLFYAVCFDQTRVTATHLLSLVLSCFVTLGFSCFYFCKVRFHRPISCRAHFGQVCLSSLMWVRNPLTLSCFVTITVLRDTLFRLHFMS